MSKSYREFHSEKSESKSRNNRGKIRNRLKEYDRETDDDFEIPDDNNEELTSRTIPVKYSDKKKWERGPDKRLRD